MMTTAEKLITEGRQEGIKKERIELAKRMLFYDEPIDKIAKYTGLKTNQIKRLKTELK